VVWGVRVTQGQRQYQNSIDHIQLFIWLNYTSVLYRFQVIVSYSTKVTYVHLPHLHLASTLGVTPVEFRPDLWYQKTNVPGLLCGVVCMILCSTILTQYWHVTERQMDRQTHDDSIHCTSVTSRGKTAFNIGSWALLIMSDIFDTALVQKPSLISLH